VVAALVAGAAAEAPPSFVLKWGGGGPEPGHFRNPHGVATDAAGNVYVADTWNGRIQEFDGEGQVIRTWIIDRSLIRGIDVAPDGNVYAADEGNNRILVFSPTGTLLRTIGSYGGGPGQLCSPWDVAVDDSGNVFVTEACNGRVQKLDPQGNYLAAFRFTTTTPLGVGVSSDGSVYVGSDRVYRFTHDLVATSNFGEVLGEVEFLAVDQAGNVYAADTRNHYVAKYTAAGVLLSQWGTLGSGDGQFLGPTGIAVDDHGAIYVAESEDHAGIGYGNNRVQKFAYTSTPTRKTTWGAVKRRYR
jgi:sugar lactone lactonase YvrE